MYILTFQPTVSVGNLGQLSADLLINTLYMSKAGYFYDDSFLPAIGNDPFAHGDTAKHCNLTTAVEGTWYYPLFSLCPKS